MALPDERIDYLTSLVDQKTDESFPIPFKGKRKSFPIVRCKTNMLVYRLKNGRTKMQQREYIDEYGLSEDFFSDQESTAAQDAQHQLLLKMVDEQGLRADLLQNDQQDPLIITSDGTVLNGNRRLACLREVPGHTYVDVVVLPPISQEEIYELEVELQMAQEFKAPYNWVNQLLTIREGVDELGIPKADIAKKMRLESQTSTEVTKLLRVLRVIDLFLERQGHPGAYYLVGGDTQKQVFRTIADKATSMKNPVFRDAFLDRAFTLIENPPAEDSLYNWVRKLAKNIDRVLVREAESAKGTSEPSISKPEPLPENKSDSETSQLHGNACDPFEELPESFSPDRVTPCGFEVPEEAKGKAPDLVRIINAADDEAREIMTAELPFKNASDAYSKLEGISLTADTTRLPELSAQLDRIAERTKRLLVEVAILMAKRPE